MAGNLGIRDFLHTQLNQSVINQNAVAWHYVFYQILISNGDTLCISDNFFGGQCELLAFYKLCLAALNVTQADFRSFCVK